MEFVRNNWFTMFVIFAGDDFRIDEKLNYNQLNENYFECAFISYSFGSVMTFRIFELKFIEWPYRYVCPFS